MTSAPQATAFSLPGAMATAYVPPAMSVGGSSMSFTPAASSPMNTGMIPVSGGGGAAGTASVPATGYSAASTGAGALNGALLASGTVGPLVAATQPNGPTEIRMIGGDDGFGSFNVPSMAAYTPPTVTASPTLLGPPAATTAGMMGASAIGGGTPVPTGPAGAPATGTAGAATATAGAQPLTRLAPGAQASDAQLVEQTLNTLRTSPSGAQLVDRLLAVGAKINVVSDDEFSAMGHGDAHAFYDPKLDTMFLRRSELADEQHRNFAAVALAHEGTHLLDDVGGVGNQMIQEITNNVIAAGGLGTQPGIEARDQGLFELMMVKETRAFVFAGSVARDLGVSVGDEDPTATAIAGGNDPQTYEAVWARLLRSSYNEQHRTAQVRFV